ncbi:uncharacterized protein BJX67DRAFT_232716 [Aspergillus lucknowensis]|uniref:C2H2-type domain-containing protein n=1 Tax=Aspergillus lucknowensis TaxID=176173 RepID=A0ABR4LHB8_9EURO
MRASSPSRSGTTLERQAADGPRVWKPEARSKSHPIKLCAPGRRFLDVMLEGFGPEILWIQPTTVFFCTVGTTKLVEFNPDCLHGCLCCAVLESRFSYSTVEPSHLRRMHGGKRWSEYEKDLLLEGKKPETATIDGNRDFRRVVLCNPSKLTGAWAAWVRRPDSQETGSSRRESAVRSTFRRPWSRRLLQGFLVFASWSCTALC